MKYLHLLKVSRTLKIFIGIFLGLLTSTLIALIVIVIIQTRPTQSTMTSKLIYQSPIKAPVTASSQAVDKPAAHHTLVSETASNPLFDYDNQTFVSFSPTTGTLMINRQNQEVEILTTPFLSSVQNLHVHNDYLLLLSINPLVPDAITPATLSLAFLPIENLATLKFIPVQTQFILPKIYTSWVSNLAETTFHSYGSNGMLLRLTKDIIIDIQTNGQAKWIHLPPLIKPLLSNQTSHLETELSSQPDELYFVLLTPTSATLKTHSFNIIRYNFTARNVLSQYQAELKNFHYFNISQTDRLITTFFDTQAHAMMFKSQPLKSPNLFKTLFSQDTGNKTLIKKLQFNEHHYPKGLRFNGIGLIGFYETPEGTDFWQWE